MYVLGIFPRSLRDFKFVDSVLTDGADVSHVPEVLVEVEVVANHELVRYLERDVVRSVAVTLRGKRSILLIQSEFYVGTTYSGRHLSEPCCKIRQMV